MEKIRNTNLGEVYTPEHVSELLKELTGKHLGSDFQTNFLIWDNCWGTGNLTKVLTEADSLYCSTLRKIDIRKNKNVCTNAAMKFDYDFLESDVEQLLSLQAMWSMEHDMPAEILEELNNPDGKPILFYINPPYVGTGNFGSNNTDFKDGATVTKLKDVMRERSLGSACDQLYAQFIYKILLMKRAYENKKIYLAIVCPPLFLSAQTYKDFRKELFSEFTYRGGALFKASEFQGLSDAWGISLQIWSPKPCEHQEVFPVDLYQTNKKGEFTCFGRKKIYNIDSERICMEWAKDELNPNTVVTAEHTLSSGCKISDKKKVNWDSKSLAYIFFKSNNIYHNEAEFGILSLPYGDGSGYSVVAENLDKSLAIFCARRCFSRYGANWTNDKDEYCIPDVNSEAYKTLVENSIIYSQFNGATHLSSFVAQLDNGKTYKVNNNLHFISAEMTKSFYENHGMPVPEGMKDSVLIPRLKKALESGRVLQSGLDVLAEAQKIFYDTLPFREEFDKKEPMYGVTNWDASYYQIKWLLKDIDLERFRKFQLMYRTFEDELRPLVHECGFLRYRGEFFEDAE